MMPGQPSTNITFSSVAFHRPYKLPVIILLLIVFITIALAVVLGTMLPKKYEGETEYKTVEIEVSPLVESPISMNIAHTYPITVILSDFVITDGINEIEVNITLLDSEGQEAYSTKDTLAMPESIYVSNKETTYVISHDIDIDIKSGHYSVQIRSDHPIRYTIVQKSKIDALFSGMVVMAILCTIILIGLLLMVDKKTKSLRASRLIAAYSAPSYGSRPYEYGQPTVYDARQYPAYQAAPQSVYDDPNAYPAYQPPLQPIYEDPNAIDYVCGKCGNLIQNPPIQGIITCERCGEKEYVQK